MNGFLPYSKHLVWLTPELIIFPLSTTNCFHPHPLTPHRSHIQSRVVFWLDFHFGSRSQQETHTRAGIQWYSAGGLTVRAARMLPFSFCCLETVDRAFDEQSQKKKKIHSQGHQKEKMEQWGVLVSIRGERSWTITSPLQIRTHRCAVSTPISPMCTCAFVFIDSWNLGERPEQE